MDLKSWDESSLNQLIAFHKNKKDDNKVILPAK